jgi:hypothetical protein
MSPEDIVWQDMYVRTALGETSPNDRQGGLGSPDVIANGIQMIQDPKQVLTATYDQYYNLPLEAGKANYIYVRAKNASPIAVKREAYVVMSNPAIVLWPGGAGWTRLKTSNAQTYSSPFGTVQPGSIGVAEDPFMFSPGAGDVGHRCLVTYLSTAEDPHPEPPPRLTTVPEVAKYIIEHPNYAHHNIDITPNTTGALTQSQPFSSGTERATWAFGIQAINAQGFTVSFSSATKFGDRYVVLEPTTIKQNDKHTITIDDVDVPPNIDTFFNYTYEQNNLQPNEWAITFVAFYQPPAGSELWHRAHTAEQLGVQNKSADWRGIQVGTIGLMKGNRA